MVVVRGFGKGEVGNYCSLGMKFLLCKMSLLCSHHKKRKRKKKTPQKNTREFLEVLNMFNILITVMTSQVCAYVQTHQDGYIKCVQFFVYQLYLNKVPHQKKKKKKKEKKNC